MLRRISILVLSILTGVLIMAGVAAVVRAQPVDGSARAAEVQTTSRESAETQQSAVRRSILWVVQTHQNSDGGYTGFSMGADLAPSTVNGTVDAIMALSAAGYSAAVPFPGKASTPIAYLQANLSDVEQFANFDGAQAGKLVLALTAAAVDVRNFSGFDAVAVLTDQLQADGSYGVSDVFKQSLAVLGLVAAGEPVPAKAVDWIIDAQATNGSWDDGFGTFNNPDATSMAIMALVASGIPTNDPVVSNARDFLASIQLDDAAWEYGPDFGGNANSTGLAVQALSALGEAWYADSGTWAKGDVNPLEALLLFQGESGAFQADYGQGPFDDFYSTVQVIPAAAGRPLPLPARFEASQRALVCLDALQDATDGGWEQFAGGGTNAAGTSRAIEAIRTAGSDPQSDRWTTKGGVNAVQYLETSTPEYLAGGRGGRGGVVTQGVVAAGLPYTVDSFANLNLPDEINSFLLPTGEYDDTAFGITAQSEAMLGLLVSDNEIALAAIEFIISAQQSGDWGDADQNGLAINVLSRAGAKMPDGAVANLAATQLADGGWGYDPDMNPSSTSEVAQGLGQIGENPFGPAWSKVVDGRLTNPADAVLKRQTANGCWPNMFGPGDDPFSTTDATILLSIQPAWDVSFIQLPVISGGGQ